MTGVILLFAMDIYGGFPLDADDPQPLVVFSNQLFWDDDIAEPSRMLPDGGNEPVSTSPVLAGTLMPLMLPDTDRTVRLDNSGLELFDSRIGEFSVLSLGTGDAFIDMDALDGDALGACILDGDEGGYASCIPPTRKVHVTISLQWDWTVKAWVIGEESPGTQVLWVDDAYTCVVIVSV